MTPDLQRPDQSSPEELLARCHANAIESYRVFGETTPGARVEDHESLVLMDGLATDSMGNVAIVTAPPADPDQVINDAAAFFAPHRRPWILFALPAAASNLAPAAVRQGLRDEGWFPGLVLDPIPSGAPEPPASMEIRQVETLEELRTFEETASRAYEVESGPVYDGWLHRPGFSFFQAYYREEPVATAALVASDGIAGIIWVGTVPEARRRGAGQAVVWKAIEAGRALGLRTSALWATPMGRPMYERMGFRPNTRYRIWSPAEFPLPRAFSSQ